MTLRRPVSMGGRVDKGRGKNNNDNSSTRAAFVVDKTLLRLNTVLMVIMLILLISVNIKNSNSASRQMMDAAATLFHHPQLRRGQQQQGLQQESQQQQQQQQQQTFVETTNVSSSFFNTSSSSSKFTSLDVQERIRYFRDTALKFQPTTDKIGVHSEHRYHNMYGQHLLAYAAVKPAFKMLEIGLGCNMIYGAGASIALWKDLFPDAELWEAEYDQECVKAALAKGQLQGIHPLVGDQGNVDTLKEWITTSGGNFDIVIDDGGHHNCQISNSFDQLWPQVLPGGYYFIEDLHVGKATKYRSWSCGNILMTDRIMEWTEQLMYQTNTFSWVWKHKLPQDVLFVSCQAEACVIGKKKSDELNGPYKPPTTPHIHYKKEEMPDSYVR